MLFHLMSLNDLCGHVSALGLAETAVELVETVIVFAPWLTDVPVIGAILKAFTGETGGGSEFQTFEKMQELLKKKKTDRQTRIDKNARYVLKASDAMKCVEDSLGNGGIILSLGRGILNWTLGKSGGTAPDVLMEKIFSCIESKTLSQKNPRTTERVNLRGRPAKGHGKGPRRIS